MKRIIFILLFLLILFFSYIFMPAAQSAHVMESQTQALGLDEIDDSLPEEASEILDGLSITDAVDLNSGMGKILENTAGSVEDLLKTGLRSALIILIIAILCAVVHAVYGGDNPNYVVLAGVLAISAVAVSDVSAFIGLGKATLDDLNTFSKVLLPTLTAAATASGAVTSAAAKYAATVLFMDVMMTFASNAVMPLIYAYTAASIAGAAMGGDGLTGASNLLKWMTTTLLTGMMIVFVAYLTLTGVISGATDAVTTRVAKTTISTVLPIVGGIISDAAETVVAGASILRNAIGIFGLFAVIAICLVPFLRLGIHYIFYKVAAGLSATISDGRLSKLVGAIGTAFGMTLGLVGATAMMMFFSIISVIKVVS